jgi:hypothetical protein
MHGRHGINTRKEATRDSGYELKSHVANKIITKKQILEHQYLIDAIMISMKPSLSHYICKRFTALMIKKHFNQFKEEEDQRRQEKVDSLDRRGKMDKAMTGLFKNTLGNKFKSMLKTAEKKVGNEDSNSQVSSSASSRIVQLNLEE